MMRARSTARPVAGPPRPYYRIESPLVGRGTTEGGDGVGPCGRPRGSPLSGRRPSNICRKPAGDASPSSPRLVAARAVPPCRGLAVAGQVLLVVGGQLAGVVGLPPHR